jgi:uncharacterized membrane protein YesL
VSRADPEPRPAAPGLGRALREAASDFYFNGWAFLVANVAVGGVLLLAVYASLYLGPWLLLLAAVAVVPAAGTMRMATRLHREGHADLGDFVEVRHHGRILLLGLAELAIAVVLAVDIAIALSWGSWLAVILLVGAAYGAVVLWALSLVAWPILLDPARDGSPIRQRLRLALLVVFLNVRRVGGLALVSALLMAVSIFLVAPVLTVAVSYVWLLAAGVTLPLADEVEARLPPGRD